MKGQLELLLTVLAVRLLERERAAECSLMIRKGKEWIRKAMARFGVASEQLETVTSRLWRWIETAAVELFNPINCLSRISLSSLERRVCPSVRSPANRVVRLLSAAMSWSQAIIVRSNSIASRQSQQMAGDSLQRSRRGSSPMSQLPLNFWSFSGTIRFARGAQSTVGCCYNYYPIIQYYKIHCIYETARFPSRPTTVPNWPRVQLFEGDGIAISLLFSPTINYVTNFIKNNPSTVGMVSTGGSSSILSPQAPIAGTGSSTALTVASEF